MLFDKHTNKVTGQLGSNVDLRIDFDLDDGATSRRYWPTSCTTWTVFPRSLATTRQPLPARSIFRSGANTNNVRHSPVSNTRSYWPTSWTVFPRSPATTRQPLPARSIFRSGANNVRHSPVSNTRRYWPTSWTVFPRSPATTRQPLPARSIFRSGVNTNNV